MTRDEAPPQEDAAPRLNLDAPEKRRILNRLKRLEGQVRGLQRMIEEERACHEILTLLAGVRSALDATGDAVLAGYLERCQADLREGRADVEEVMQAVRLARGRTP
ncbi:MAG: metal-sensitive transcriptional regulator [Trueperaceae bacterium]|nr:metal-sensitive transcriptional regulator [Trueperaceae bacterium]